MYPVTVTIISAANCGACRSFKSRGVFSDIKKVVEELGSKYVNYELPAMNDRLEEKDLWNAFLNKYARVWFPIIIVAYTSDIDAYNSRNLSDAQLMSSIAIFNGRPVTGDVLSIKSEMTYNRLDRNTIKEWIASYTSKTQPVSSTATRYADNVSRVPQLIIDGDDYPRNKFENNASNRDNGHYSTLGNKTRIPCSNQSMKITSRYAYK